MLARLTTALAALLLAACSGSEETAGSFETRSVVGPRLAAADQAVDESTREDAVFAEAQLTLLASTFDLQVRREVARAVRDSGDDWVVPRLLVCLRNETDETLRIELARTLAHFGNWAGLDALYRLQTGGSDRTVRTAASNALEELAAQAGAPDALSLWRLWNDGDMDEQLPVIELGPVRLLETWQMIAKLTSSDPKEREDAAYSLSNSDSSVTALLAATLHESDPESAIRAAGCLAEMGRRALRAGPDLVLALNAPHLAVHAAAALGRVRYPAAAQPLVHCLSPERPLELRLAAAEALGRLGLPETFDDLDVLLQRTEPSSLRVAAATALIRAEDNPAAARVAFELYQDAQAQASGEAEAALGLWIERRALTGDELSRSALNRWNEPAAPPGLEPTAEERSEQRARRITAIESLLGSSAQE